MRIKSNRGKLLMAGILACITGSVGLRTAVAQLSNQGVQAKTTTATGYILGPNDEIAILSLHAEELSNKKFRVAPSGEINLPMIGRIQASGRTLQDLEAEVIERLKRYVNEPDVVINVTQYKSQPVTVFGAVRSPGVLQLEGRKTLIEMLSQAGGLRQDAGSRIRITRRSDVGSIPLESAKTEGEYSVAEVNVRSIEDATRPSDNILILPYDVITVPRADIVYVMGDVRKPGGFALNDRRGISVLEVLARAEGTGPNAAKRAAKIIRPVPGSNRVEISVNVEAVLKGKSKDVMLQPDDILFVPESYSRGAVRRTLDTLIELTTGMIVYR